MSADTSSLNLLLEPVLEPPATGSELHAYRFFWMRTFDERRLFRVTVEPDQTLTVVRKAYWGKFCADGQIEITWVERETFTYGPKEIDWWLDQIAAADFWNLNPEDEPRYICDGSGWTIEAVKSGHYHEISRRSPECERILGLAKAFFELAQYQPGPNGFY